MESINHGIKSNTLNNPNSLLGKTDIKFNAASYDHDGLVDIVYMPRDESVMNRQAVASEHLKIFNMNRQSSKIVGNNEEKDKSKETNVVNESLNNRFKWKPTSLKDFGTVKCKASNEIGSTECTYELKLGGKH